MEQLSKKPEGNFKAAKIILEDKEYGMPEYYQGSPTKTMQEMQAFLDKLELETYTKIIYGQLPITEFDSFVENGNHLVEIKLQMKLTSGTRV